MCLVCFCSIWKFHRQYGKLYGTYGKINGKYGKYGKLYGKYGKLYGQYGKYGMFYGTIFHNKTQIILSFTRWQMLKHLS